MAEEKDKKKPKEKDVLIREYGKDLIYYSETLLEKNLESITKVLIPFLFVLMFIPGISAIASALFLTNYFVYLMSSEEWKDEFKDAAKAKVLVDEAKFEDKKAEIKEKHNEAVEKIQSNLKQNLNIKNEEISFFKSKNIELQQGLDDLQKKQERLEASFASIVLSGYDQGENNLNKDISEQSL